MARCGFWIAAFAFCAVLAGCSRPVEFDFTVPGDAPYEELRAALSPCSEEFVSDVPWTNSFSLVEAWYQVVEFDGSELPSREPAGELDVVAVATGEPTRISVVGPVLVAGENETIEPAVTWAVEEAELYIGTIRHPAGTGTGADDLAIDAPIVDSIVRLMVVLPDVSPFFIGDCGEEWVGDSLRETLGDEAMATFVQTALSLTGDELLEYVSGNSD